MTSVDRTWKFGALRNVVVNTDPAAWEEMDYLLKMDSVITLLAGRTLHVIGEADQMTQLVRLGDDPTIHALIVLDTASLFPVAANLNTLTAFLDDVASFWYGREQNYTLDTTHDNLELAQIMLESFEAANPGCDVGFWEYHCLAGLNMGFPLG
jgi:hypothetical protein